MTFREQFPDYEAYDEPRFRTVPDGMGGMLRAYIMRKIPGDKPLKAVCDEAASFVPSEPTDNWGREYLAEDLRGYLDALASGRFHCFMDFMAHFATRRLFDPSILGELNDLFEASDFGYRLVADSGNAYWAPVEAPTATTVVLEESIALVEGVVPQAKRHLEQAKEHVKKAEDDRSRKDALRDTLSAMEAVVKHVSGEGNFDRGCEKLKDIPGLKTDIAREPKRIWVAIHDGYPDVRHGVPAISEISREEAEYWIDRVLATLNLLVRLHGRGGY